MIMTRLEMFVNLGYKVDPFKKPRFETGDALRVRKILTMGVESHAMLSIVGERGIGKSEAIKAALAKLGVKIVIVHKADRTKVSISDVERALILDLSDEKPKGGGETRSRQLRRVLGEGTRKRKIVLLIEEAQRLHGATLKSLKTLREIEWMGESELFTIVLVGQSDPMQRAGVSEVRLRSDCVRMQGLTSEEAGSYVRATVGTHFDAAAIDALSELPQATNYLELQELCVELLNHALAAGRELVSVEDVRSLAADKQLALPRGAARGKQAAPVSGSSALKSALAQRGAGNVEEKEAVAC
uniref:AAA ATPase n=1 Tax=Geobacter sp. (strain M21) TaxID=443144 RepID=C6E6T9_GEOSM